MKSNQKNLLPILAILFFAALATLTSCRKDPEEIIELISNTEAAEIIEDAVSNRTAGLVAPTIDAAAIVESALNSCGIPGDTTFTKAKTSGAATYDYTFGMEWLLTCSQLGVPQSAQVDVTGNGDFTSPHWAGNEASVSNLVFAGLSPQEAAYIVNGTYNRTGNLNGNLRKVSPNFDCVVSIELSNLTLDKTSHQITGGNGMATITATNANGQTRTLNGTLVFHGDGSATVVVNGHEHTFEWQ